MRASFAVFFPAPVAGDVSGDARSVVPSQCLREVYVYSGVGQSGTRGSGTSVRLPVRGNVKTWRSANGFALERVG